MSALFSKKRASATVAILGGTGLAVALTVFMVRAPSRAESDGAAPAQAGSNAAGSSKAPGVRVAGRRDPWALGSERVYAADFGSTLEGDKDAENGTLTLVGSASMTLAPIDVKPEHVSVWGRLSEVSLVVGNEGEAGKHIEDAVRPTLTQPFVIRLTHTGKLESLAVEREVRGFAHNIVRTLVATLQFVEPEAKQEWREWFTVESDHNGTYKARYVQSEPGQFTKNKLEYSYLDVLAKTGGSAQLSRAKVHAESSISRHESGVISEVRAQESLELPFGTTGFKSRSHASIKLEKVGVAAVPQIDTSRLVSTTLYETRGGGKRSRELELERKRKLVDGRTFSDLHGELSKLPATTDNDTARWDVAERMAALFDIDPATVNAAALALRRESSPENGRMVLAALSDSGSPEAQAAMAQAVEDSAVDRGLRDSALTQLGLLESPTPETLSTLDRISKKSGDPAESDSATLALGGAARRAAQPAAAADAAEDVVSDLIARYRAARTPEERALFLVALGNAGAVEALPLIEGALGDALPQIRSAAVRALRFIQAAQVDSLIAGVLSNDSEPSVRLSAIGAASYRNLSAPLVTALAAALKSEKVVATRLQIVSIFAKQLRKNVALRPILELAAQSDPSEDVKKAANKALSAPTGEP